MLDRAFTAADVTPIVVAEADVLSTILSAVRTGIGNAIIPKGDLADISGEDLAQPILIEPPIYLTASIFRPVIIRSRMPVRQSELSLHNLLTVICANRRCRASNRSATK